MHRYSLRLNDVTTFLIKVAIYFKLLLLSFPHVISLVPCRNPHQQHPRLQKLHIYKDIRVKLPCSAHHVTSDLIAGFSKQRPEGQIGHAKKTFMWCPREMHVLNTNLSQPEERIVISPSWTVRLGSTWLLPRIAYHSSFYWPKKEKKHCWAWYSFHTNIWFFYTPGVCMVHIWTHVRPYAAIRLRDLRANTWQPLRSAN